MSRIVYLLYLKKSGKTMLHDDDKEEIDWDMVSESRKYVAGNVVLQQREK